MSLLRFVIAGQHVHPSGAALHDLAHLVQAARPAHQVARGEIVVGLDIHQFLKGLRVVVNVGKDQ